MNINIQRGAGQPLGLASISNTAITAITNIDVTGFNSAIYDNYEVWISNGQPGTDNVILELETSTDGGTTFDTGTSDYRWTGTITTEAGTDVAVADADDSEIEITLGNTVGSGTNENINVKVRVFSPETAEFTAFTWQGRYNNINGAINHPHGAGDRQSAADVDALRFHWSSGDWVEQGKIQFLGIRQ